MSPRPTRHTRPWLLLLLLPVLLSAPGAARADDGGVSFGGAPRLLAGHKTVSMQSEVVRMRVGSKIVQVDCQFVFQNAGPACTVRMGFPDRGRGVDDPEEEPSERRGPARGTFLSYVSYVDGARVPTQTVRGAQSGDFWHVKVVRFGAGQTRHVHDVYTLPLSSSVAGNPGLDGDGDYNQTYYILQTASSWHGPIRRAEVVVTFAPGLVRPPLTLIALSSVGNNPQALPWARIRPGTVLYRGPCVPTVQGTTLRFVRTDFRPAYLDDILLTFHFRRFPKSP